MLPPAQPRECEPASPLIASLRGSESHHEVCKFDQSRMVRQS
jgi:hypothetical protein